MQFEKRIASFILFAGMIYLAVMPRQLLANDVTRSLQWALNTAPPFHIVDGIYRDQGICDTLMSAVEAALPDYPTERRLMPQTRIGMLFEREVDQCFPCMIYQENTASAQTWFSQPTHMYQPHGIIARPDVARQLRETFGEPVPLRKLLADNDFRFGYPAGRQYGTLQPILNAYEGDNSYRLIRTGEHATTAILEMILAGRIHYTIDYHSLLRYHQRTAQGELEFVRIEENEGQIVLGAIGCTNSEWGRQVISDINHNLSTIQQDPGFMQSLKLWFEGRSSLID
ncbi:MAG: ABC transporter substrate-binding protein [Idiomarina sp.]|nr:ABC transporter substrate-binding protein [Idiomarina sp.]